MPPKRSKSKERKKKQKYREKMSEEKRKIENEKLKERVKMLRERKGEPGKKRETLTSTLWGPGLLYRETELYRRYQEMDKLRMKEKRANFNDEERKLENQEAKLRMRERREHQTDGEREDQNQKNNERMRRLRKMRKDIIAAHSDDNMNDNTDSSSDIVKQLNEEHRANQEKDILGENQRKETEPGLEECICDFDIDCPYCTEQNENEKHLYVLTSKEDSDRIQKDELEAYKYLKRKERREKRKALLEKAKRPLPPLPERELSEYEKIREKFIAQRKQEWEIYEKEWEKQWQENKQS